MTEKIKEKVIEPAKIRADFVFKIKIKAVRGATYNEQKTKTYQELEQFTYNQLKGV